LAAVTGSEPTFERGMRDGKQIEGAERLDLRMVGKPDLIEAMLIWLVRLNCRRKSTNPSVTSMMTRILRSH
jgi:hypothetical protein